jgi:uncharacterized membrane protein YagU involved in acid resistance
MKTTKRIILAGLIAGTLDALAAVILFPKHYTLHSMAGVFRYISRGIFGNSVAPWGALYPVIGLILHYLIAMIWSAVYVLVLIRVFKTGSIWAKTILFGSLVWTIMNGFVLPIVGLNIQYDGWAIMESFSVILFCVSLPICLVGERQASVRVGV